LIEFLIRIPAATLLLFLLLHFFKIIVHSEAIYNIRHEGLGRTNQQLVGYYLIHRTGSIFTDEHWLAEKNALMDLDIFASVKYDTIEDENGILLTYKFRELPSFIIYPGMKRTDQDGLLIGPGISFLNLFGFGIRQEFLNRYTASPEPFSAKELLSYTYIPENHSLPFNTELLINYFSSYNSLKLFNENSINSELSFNYRLSPIIRNSITATYLNVKNDNKAPEFRQGSKPIPMFLSASSEDIIFGAGYGFIIDTRERIMNPHYGFYNELKSSLYYDQKGGTVQYLEFIYDSRGYIPSGDRNIFHYNLMARYRPGTIPGYELYHIGGVNSLRTYSPAPELCGQHEILATIEYRYELFANREISFLDNHGYYGLQLVAGVDHALFWFPGEKKSEGKYLASVFTGIHLLVPALERVRLELGFNNPDMKLKEINFGINLGWYEKAYNQRRRVR
jgi:outer membrane protein assembly factor BamA